VPAGHTASATLVLSHEAGVEPARAMATDESLLATRVVAERTIAALGLAMTPEALMKTVGAVPTTSDVLVLNLTGPSDAEAVRRLSAFTTVYLQFRATQVSAQADVLLAGFDQRIATLQNQAGVLTKRISTLSAAGGDASGQLDDAITQRAQLLAQIGTLQQSVQDTLLRKASVVSASRVIDPAAAPPGGGTRRLALTLGSGLIGGTALGVGVVLLLAILSNRLRLRVEVAAALETPVLLSVRRLTPPALLRRLPRPARARARADVDRRRAADTIQAVLPSGERPGHRGGLVVGCVDNADEVRFAVAAAALALRRRGQPVRLVDLTESGGLAAALSALAPAGPARADGRADGPAPNVLRPDALPLLDAAEPDPHRAPDDPGDADDADDPDHVDGAEDDSDGVLLVLADLDPAIGGYHLTDWADRVLVAVTGGRSSAERVRTTADLLAAAGLELTGALLLRTDPQDASSGSFPPGVWRGGRALPGQGRPAPGGPGRR